jgi:hypothetical protein
MKGRKKVAAVYIGKPPRKRKVSKAKPRPFINDETYAASWGPLEIDVEMARAHGWSERSIAACYDVLCAEGKRRGAAGRRAHPERYEKNGQGMFKSDAFPHGFMHGLVDEKGRSSPGRVGYLGREMQRAEHAESYLEALRKLVPSEEEARERFVAQGGLGLAAILRDIREALEKAKQGT